MSSPWYFYAGKAEKLILKAGKIRAEKAAKPPAKEGGKKIKDLSYLFLQDQESYSRMGDTIIYSVNETLEVVHTMVKHIFTGLETRVAKELEVIRSQYHSKPVEFNDDPCVVHWLENQDNLKDKCDTVSMFNQPFLVFCL